MRRSPNPRDRCVHALFEREAALRPDDVAAVCAEQRLGYRELDRRANGLARRLRGLGVGPETLVGICLERSVDQVVSLLAVLKAGGAFVPMDPAYPDERLRYLLEDSAAGITLSRRRIAERVPESPTRWEFLDELGLEAAPADEPPKDEASPENLAYVLYTSGSTGRPKGVCVSHRAVVRSIYRPRYVPFEAGDCFLYHTSLSFDPSILEILIPLLNGGRVAVLPPGPITLRGISRAIDRWSVNSLNLVTPLFHAMVEENLEGCRPLKFLICGGEAFSRDCVMRALDGLPETQLVLCYGPTENTVISTAYAPATSEEVGASPFVPLGEPIPDTQLHVLDASGRPVTTGTTGEIHLGGERLARGYLGRDALNAEHFVADPFDATPGAKLYRTGDLARRHPDGRLEFLGRRDGQFKIRGYRVERGEIEAVLRQCDGILEAAVTVATGRRTVLTAYLTARRDAAPTRDDMLRFLRRRLPSYMVPGRFALLDEVPRNTNGKLDRASLPDPGSPEFRRQELR